MTDKEKLALLQPDFAALIVKLMDAVKARGHELMVTQGLRTFEEQNALYAKGRTKPGPKVTNAKGGESYHNYGLACFSADTEVLTNSGWKLFQNLTEDDWVMAFKDGALRLEKPFAYIAYHYSGEMVKVRTRSVDLLATPDHKFITQVKTNGDWSTNWEETRADELAYKHRMPAAGVWADSSEAEHYPFSDRLTAEEWWTFLGWYISEGSACGVSNGVRREHSGRNKVRISQAGSSEYRAEIKSLLSKFGTVWEQGHDLMVDRKRLWDEVFPIGNSYTKRIPRYALNAPKRLLECLLTSLLKGDGTFYKKREVYWTVNKHLADDVSELCIRLGLPHVIDKKIPNPNHILPHGQPPQTINDQWFVSIRRSRTQELRNGSGAPRISREQYDGNVYCVSLPSRAMVVRRNGKVAICGNCDFALKEMVNGSHFPDPHPVWGVIGEEARKLGLEWGGDWKSISDRPHVQMPMDLAEVKRWHTLTGREGLWARVATLLQAKRKDQDQAT